MLITWSSLTAQRFPSNNFGDPVKSLPPPLRSILYDSSLKKLQTWGSSAKCPGGEGTHIFFCTGTCRWTGYHFQDSDSGTGYHFCKNRLHDRVHICHFWLRKVVLGHLHSANVIQIAWMAIFPHFLIDFVQLSLQSTILPEETKG